MAMMLRLHGIHPCPFARHQALMQHFPCVFVRACPWVHPSNQVTRIQLACAAYKHAWHMRADDSMASQAMEGQLTLQEVCWMRAQWLLARTLCAALFNVRVAACSMLCCPHSALMG
jgi:hypothetical protein